MSLQRNRRFTQNYLMLGKCKLDNLGIILKLRHCSIRICNKTPFHTLRAKGPFPMPGAQSQFISTLTVQFRTQNIRFINNPNKTALCTGLYTFAFGHSSVLSLHNYGLSTAIMLCTYYCRHALGALQRTLDRIRTDLDVKNNSLQVDQQCMAVRESLAQHPHPSELARPPTN